MPRRIVLVVAIVYKGYCSQIVSIVDDRSHPEVTNIQLQACGCNPTGFSGHRSTLPAFRGLNFGMGQSYLANRPMLHLDACILVAGLYTPGGYWFLLHSANMNRAHFLHPALSYMSTNISNYLSRCHPTLGTLPASHISNTNPFDKA